MAERVFIWPPSSELEIPSDYVGVVVERLPNNRLHVGLLYKTAQASTYVLDLMGHYGCRLGNNPPMKGQLCVLCPVDPLRVPALAAFFRRLYRKNKNPGLPYGFSSPDQDWFSRDGAIQLSNGKIGLCCQTFVLAAYRAAELPLIDPPDVPQREDDAERQNSLLDEWAADIADSGTRTQQHFTTVRASIGTPLCRPLEVGGAAMAEIIPCDWETAFHNATEVENKMNINYILAHISQISFTS